MSDVEEKKRKRKKEKKWGKKKGCTEVHRGIQRNTEVYTEDERKDNSSKWDKDFH